MNYAKTAIFIALCFTLLVSCVSNRQTPPLFAELIASEKDNTAVGFTGGTESIIGFHKFSQTSHMIFYSSADAENAHAVAHIVTSTGEFDMRFSSDGLLKSIQDDKANQLSLTYRSDGSVAYEMLYMDSFALRRKTGVVPPIRAGLRGQRMRRSSQSKSSINGPAVGVKMRVTACDSYPSEPINATLSYDFGQGRIDKPVEATNMTNHVFTYYHTIAPLNGFRDDSTAIDLVTDGYPGGYTPCTMKNLVGAICAALTGSPLAYSACRNLFPVVARNCDSDPIAKVIKWREKKQVSDGRPTRLAVTGSAKYNDVYGNSKTVSVTRAYDWDQIGPTLDIKLPCWDTYQGEFYATDYFTHTTPDGSCQSKLDLGKRVTILIPESQREKTYVNFDYYKLLNDNPPCWYGPYPSDYPLGFPGRMVGDSFYASFTQQLPWKEVYTFDLDRQGKSLVGTYRFQMNHVPSSATADVTVNVALPLVVPARGKRP